MKRVSSEKIDFKSVIERTFLPYQLRWIHSRAKLNVCLKARQVGMTFTQAFLDVKSCMMNEFDCNYVCQSLESGKEYLRDCAQWARVLNYGIGSDLVNSDSEMKLQFKNGRKIQIRTSKPRSLRGLTGRIVLDEFGFLDEQEETFATAEACASWKGDIRILSTPSSKRTFFYKLAERMRKDPNPNEFFMEVSLEDAIKDGLLEKILKRKPTEEDVKAFVEQKRRNLSEKKFLREYMLKFDDEDECDFFPLSLTIRCFDPELTYSPKPGDRIAIGVDVARMRNFTCMSKVAKTSDGDHFLFEFLRLKRLDLKSQVQALKSFVSTCPGEIFIDAGGMGAFFCDACEDEGLRINRVFLNDKNKLEMAETTRNLIEQGKFFSRAFESLLDDFLSIKYKEDRIITSQLGDFHGNADGFWSAALAIYGLKKDSATFSTSDVITIKNERHETLEQIIKRFQKRKRPDLREIFLFA